MGRSITGFCLDDTGGRFGPFENQMFLGDFSLSLVTLYARMIEDAYFLQRYRDCLMVRLDTSREFVHVNGRGLIAIEENGQVIAALTALGYSPAEARAAAATPAVAAESEVDDRIRVALQQFANR